MKFLGRLFCGCAFTAVFGMVSMVRASEWWTVVSSHESAPGNSILNETKVSAGAYAMEEDRVLGQKVMTAGKDGLVLDSQSPSTGARELRARVRLKTDVVPNGNIIFHVARTGRPETEILLSLAASRTSESITGSLWHGAKPLHDLQAEQARLDWNSNDSPSVNVFLYALRSYATVRPGWPEDFRARIEQDMAALPDHNHKWLDVRIELEQGRVRFWVDDRLVSQKVDPSVGAEGAAQINLSPGAQIASYHTGKVVEEPKDFLTIRLGGYVNGREFVDHASVQADALPPADAPVFVNDIPFVFSGVNLEGNDHLDIGRSLYRECNQEGYFPTHEQSWGGSLMRDPARIRLRVPNGTYDRLYLIAASDNGRDALPVVTAMFYRPSAGFSESFGGTVPLATARSSTAKALPVTLSNGRKVNLWLVEIPLDPSKLTSLSDLDIVEVELTKKVYQYRAYPDPMLSGWHQGGRPSAAHVYAATLGMAPVGFAWTPDRFGHVWTPSEVPGYTATVTNRTSQAQSGKLMVVTRSYDGTEETKQGKTVMLDKGATTKVTFSVPVKLNGYHDITATLEMAGKSWTEKRSFVRLAPDTRAPRWTEGKGVLFGYWSYHGGHYTPGADHVIDLMTAAGARTSSTVQPSTNNVAAREHWTRVTTSASGCYTAMTPWTKDSEEDPQKRAAYQQAVVDQISKYWSTFSDAYRPDQIPILAEPSLGPRLTDGNYPEYWGEKSYELTEQEKTTLKRDFDRSKAAAEAIRAKWPNDKILIPYGDPLYVVPFLRSGFPTNLIDGSALDTCGFSRLPEQQLHQVSLHRLYCLRKEYEKVGITDPILNHYEGIFVPTEVGNCSWREQMDIYNRWSLISMAYGVKRFYSGWFAFDCGSWYGAEQYGGCGIQRRIPYCDPKPAYAAYATMTDKLDQANFDGWLKTGSLTTYCLRFKGPKGNVYTLWTLRGTRTVILTLAEEGEVQVTDVMNNTKVIKSQGRKVTLRIDPSVTYVSTKGAIQSVEAGEAEHVDAQPAPDATVVADLGDGSWKYTSERDLTYEKNDFDTTRYPGRFSQSVGTDPKHGQVLVSKLEMQEKVHELMPWYNTLAPRKPVVLKGAPTSIGLWIKGASDWGRVVYCLRDAKGERWISVGTKDQWNCDDMHSWSSFNFDGWRYLRFELPGHVGYDNFRKHGTTWWGSEGGDGVVDLPLKLEKIIVEQRSHILYVNDVQPVASATVSFGKLFVEYASPEDAREEAVRVSKLRMPSPTGMAELPNPIKEMAYNGAGEATAITKLEPPVSQNDGTTVKIYFKEIPDAKTYFVWCSAHADGSGAVNMTPGGAKNGGSIGGLRPVIKLYFWVTCQNAKGQMSKPSELVETTLVDTFKEK